jgi:hypothetical protein
MVTQHGPERRSLRRRIPPEPHCDAEGFAAPRANA